MKCPKKQTQKVDQWLPGKLGLTTNGHKRSQWGDGNVTKLGYGDDGATR